MFDTRSARAQALGFGFTFLLALPYADGTVTIDDAAQLLSSIPVEATPVPPSGGIVIEVYGTSRLMNIYPDTIPAGDPDRVIMV